MRTTFSRVGYSLTELLVTISLIAVLVGILLTAVQKVRIAAARLDCGSNLRQIGTALHMYHDVQHGFPPGFSYRRDNSRFLFLGWTARVLPYLEQSPLWSRIEQAFRSDSTPWEFYGSTLQNRILGTPIRAFACPSDPRTPGPAIMGSKLVAFTSYLGVEGIDGQSHDGVLYIDSCVRVTDIRDGTSHTLLVGERPPAADLKFGWWYRGWGQHKNGSAEMILGVRERNMLGARYNCPVGPYHFTAGRFDNQCDMFHFWSPHGNGGNFLFADGAVRFLGISADSVIPSLATRASGEILNDF